MVCSVLFLWCADNFAYSVRLWCSFIEKKPHADSIQRAAFCIMVSGEGPTEFGLLARAPE